MGMGMGKGRVGGDVGADGGDEGGGGVVCYRYLGWTCLLYE